MSKKSNIIAKMRSRTHPQGECHNYGCTKWYPKFNRKPVHDTFQYDLLKAMYPDSALLL